jgi:hypothetical protein
MCCNLNTEDMGDSPDVGDTSEVNEEYTCAQTNNICL